MSAGRTVALTLATVLLSTLFVSPAAADGEEVDGFPNWEERVLLQFANRARAEPAVEMAACGDACPDASCYVPRPALRHDHALGRAARFHADEMRAQGFFGHSSRCTIVSDIDGRYPDTCLGETSCACVGGATGCSPNCQDAQQRVGLFGAGFGGEIIYGGTNPSTGFFAWLYEPTTDPTCGFTQENGHRFLLLNGGGAVGFGVSGQNGVGDFGGGQGGGPIASGTHFPRTGPTVEAWANWESEQGPQAALIDVDGTCAPMTLERGVARSGAYRADVTGVGAGCHRYFFVFKDAAGQTVTYPTEGSLGIGPEGTCPDFSDERPPQGDGCMCTPACDARACGDDGCGGSCGSCDPGYSCTDGSCAADPGVPLPDGPGANDDPEDSGDPSADPSQDPDEGSDPASLPPGFGDPERADLAGCGCRPTSHPSAGWLWVVAAAARRRRRKAASESGTRCGSAGGDGGGKPARRAGRARWYPAAVGDDVTRTLNHADPGVDVGVAFLEITEGAAQRRLVEIGEAGLVVGRSDGADLRLDADGVSRKHARVVCNGPGLFNVLDLGSRNGTFLNGRKVDVAVLRDGDEIKVGQAILRFSFRREGDTSPISLESTQPTTPQLDQVLTAREFEVSRLVSEGMTNAEIGKQLHISPRTVATHLANIYERLDIHSRAALARFVAHSDRRR